jgi:hypothetical protein
MDSPPGPPADSRVVNYLRALIDHYGALATGFVMTAFGIGMELGHHPLHAVGWALVAVILVGPAGYLAWRDERRRVLDLSRRVTLTVSLLSEQDHRATDQHERFALLVTNQGPGVAESVSITLLEVTPRPKMGLLARLPQRLGPPIGEPLPTAMVIGNYDRRINEGESERFPLLDALQGQFAHQVVGIDGFDFAEDGVARHRRTILGPTERWSLHLTIAAANAVLQELNIVVEVRDERIVVELLPLIPS